MDGIGNVTIGIPSFLRPGYLAECLTRIKANLPECEVIVVDDSDKHPRLPAWVHYITLPFDSGLPAKRNASVKACKTKYWLCGCDDYDLGPANVRSDLHTMVEFLDNHPNYTVVGGRFENNPYEGHLTYVPGSHIRETLLEYNGDNFQDCDLMANYFLARTEDIRNIPWDERMKIGGEHGDWFLKLKLLGRKVAWAKGVNINTLRMSPSPGLSDPRYGSFRARARNLGHKIFLEKRDIKHYYGFGS